MITEDCRRILDIAVEQLKADGCKGCAYIDTEEWEEPCRRCSWRKEEKE